MNLLQEILSILTIAANAAQTLPVGGTDVKAGEALAAALLAIAQKATAAYEAQTGQPLDLSLLHKIDPVV